MTRALQRQDFAGDAVDVARSLIGATLLVDGVGGLIVEAEAYDMTDAAAHTHRGPTERNRAMFGPPGHAYVYFNYGLHWCLNFVCRESGHGAGVLIRALQPTHGLDRMRQRRGLDDERLLCAGPGRVGQALGITKALYGLPLDEPVPIDLLPPHGTTNGMRGRADLMLDLIRRYRLTPRQLAQQDAHLACVGTPADAADLITEWFEQRGCDGFIAGAGAAGLPGFAAWLRRVVPVQSQCCLLRSVSAPIAAVFR